MSAYRQLRKIQNAGGDRKVMSGENPKYLLFCLNTRKGEVTRDFSPEKFVNSFACKRNYFVLQSESAAFACWRERNVECINATK